MQPDDEVEHRTRHLELHVERERLDLREVDPAVRSGVDHWVQVGGGDQPEQLHALGRAPLPGGAVRQRHVHLDR